MATEESKMSGNGPESEPVEILNNEAARLYSYAYPGIVFGLFSVRFGATVADPISSLSQLLLSVCILQAIYMSMCLPAATSMRPSLPSQSTSITEPSPQQQQQDQKLPSTRPSFPISYLTTKIHVCNSPQVPNRSITDLFLLSQPSSPLFWLFASPRPS